MLVKLTTGHRVSFWICRLFLLRLFEMDLLDELRHRIAPYRPCHRARGSSKKLVRSYKII
jgi:hypothetical protein